MLDDYYDFLRTTDDYGEGWLKRLFECLDQASQVPTRCNILFYPFYDDDDDDPDCSKLIMDLDRISVLQLQFEVS